METKICTKCKKDKPLCDFSMDNSKKSGKRSSCKNCLKKNVKVINIQEKKCIKCDKILNINHFSRDKNKKDGLNYYCKKCINIKVKPIGVIFVTYKKCKTCNTVKSRDLFNSNSLAKDGLNCKCKICVNSYYKNYRKLNKPVYKSIYKPKNGFSKFKLNARSLILQSFKRACKGVYKKSLRTEKILGCSLKEFQEHLESLFTKGMSWTNHGKYKIHGDLVWNIDHRIPISSAKTEEEIIKLCHYTNLQPMWALENIQKSNK